MSFLISLLRIERYDLGRALSAAAAIRSRPEDTRNVYKLLHAFRGYTSERMLKRFDRDPTGSRLLSEKRNIRAVLADKAVLRGMPEGSLGRAYAAFMESTAYVADWLTAEDFAASNLTYARLRVRDTHDLWHAVTGRGGDFQSETAYLVFMWAQIQHPGMLLLALLTFLHYPSIGFARKLGMALWYGLRAEWFPAVAWEDLLHLPLRDVQRRLRVDGWSAT